MIANASLLPSDHVMSACDHASAVAACRAADTYAQMAIDSGADAGARGSLAAIIAAMETALRALGANG